MYSTGPAAKPLMHTSYVRAYRLSFTVGGRLLNFTCGKQKTFYPCEIRCLIKPSVIRFWQAAQSALVDSLKIQFCFTFSCALSTDNYLWWHSDGRTDTSAQTYPLIHACSTYIQRLALAAHCLNYFFFLGRQWKLITSASRPPNKQRRASRVEEKEFVRKTERQGQTRSCHERHWALWKIIIQAWKEKEKEGELNVGPLRGRGHEKNSKKWNWLNQQPGAD